MMTDEPFSAEVRDWARKALWQAKNDQKRAIEIFQEKLLSDPALAADVAAVIVRSAMREIGWTDKPMG